VTPPLFAHVLPNFQFGGAEVRTTQLINRFGRQIRQVVIALGGEFGASQYIDPSLGVRYIPCLNSGRPVEMMRRHYRLLSELKPSLVFTYNWAAIDAAIAAGLGRIAPVIHTEDGVEADEAYSLKARRTWWRRAFLRLCRRVVAPSQVLREVMRDTWWLPEDRIRWIPNGVDAARFNAVPEGWAFPREEFVIGSVASLRRVKRHEMMIDLGEALAKEIPVRVLLCGDGPDRGMLEQYARDRGMAERVEFLGWRADTEKVLSRMDVFCLTSYSEQMPLSVLEAMSCRLPVCSLAVGDVASMVSAENRPFIASSFEHLADAARRLYADCHLRKRVGIANRAQVEETYSIERMYENYAHLYREVKPGLPLS
jgi:glycosyltransferase involved in cell wall biosynthesis